MGGPWTPGPPPGSAPAIYVMQVDASVNRKYLFFILPRVLTSQVKHGLLVELRESRGGNPIIDCIMLMLIKPMTVADPGFEVRGPTF